MSATGKSGSRGSENAFYSVQFQHCGRRMEMSLGTPNQMEAAAKAKERYFFLIANGWEVFLAKFRAKETLPMNPDALTVGDFLAAVRKDAELSATTVDGYA